MRLFPYNFLSIEYQGANFDNPNRLFFSVESTFNNISNQVSDFRELIPEFFYLPEMFMNINNINFGKKDDGMKVDDCIVPNDNKEETIEKFCIFINEMRDYLEKAEKDKDISKWIQIIFGIKQKYENYKKNMGQYFRSECYIDNLSLDFSERIIDQTIIAKYDFGTIPLKTIDNDDTFNNIKNNFLKPNLYTYYHKKVNLNFGIKIELSNKINTKDLITSSINEIDLDNIKSCHSNKFLNMVATCSFDGVISVYIKPNKLISIIKDPDGSYFDEVFLFSNPFPCVIAVKESRYLKSYSISGMLIKTYLLDKKYKLIFDFAYKIKIKDYQDLIVLISEIEEEKEKKVKILKVPFFNELKKK